MTKQELAERIKQAMSQEDVDLTQPGAADIVLNTMAIGIANAIAEYVKNPED